MSSSSSSSSSSKGKRSNNLGPLNLKKKAQLSFETRAIQSSQPQSLISQQNFTLNNTVIYT
jgi:hypothetical protein